MISARPLESRSSVAKSWKTRTGSSELSTVTALLRRIRFVLHRGSRQDNSRRGRDEVRSMMLAQTKHVEPHLVGQLNGLQQVVHSLGRADQFARHWVGGQLGKGVDAYLELTCGCTGGVR